MDKQATVSVIICSYNRADYIIGALNSLYHQSASFDNFEVLVVDNNSTDDTAVRCKHFIDTHPRFHAFYHTEKQQGASFARNTGAALATGDLLAFMDDDAIAEQDFVERIIDFFKKHPDANGLGGRITPKYIPAEPVWMSHCVASLVGNFDYSKELSVFKPGKYPLESNMVVHRKDFERIGGFNTALPGVKGTLRIGGEGKDLFL